MIPFVQRRHHYEQAFEEHLRERRVPYIAVDEARKALLGTDRTRVAPEQGVGSLALKSFDFVIYGRRRNLLVEVKGRRINADASGPSRLQCWATREDIDSLTRWESLFGPEFEASLVFLYWCEGGPPAPLFEEVFHFRERWYAVRAIPLSDYAAHMRPRSARWGTVHVPASVFDRLSGPLLGVAGESPSGAGPLTPPPEWNPGEPPANGIARPLQVPVPPLASRV
jgi:hypothetical protein